MNEKKRKRYERAAERRQRIKDMKERCDREEEIRAQRRKNRTRSLNVVKFAIIFAVIGIIVFVGFRGIMTYRISMDYKEALAENEKLKAEKRRLEEELKHVNDLEYVEQQARQQLKMVKPGEVMYILPQEQKGDSESEENKTE